MQAFQWMLPKHSLSDPVATIRKNRGFSKSDVLPIAECKLEDPFLFPEMEYFVNRLQQAEQTQEKVVVLSDFDTDGATCAALAQTEIAKYLNLECIAPDRYIDGYSVNKIPKYTEGPLKGACMTLEEIKGTDYYHDSVLKKVVDAQPSLLIMADIGVRNWAEVQLFKQIGWEVLIIDHHEPGERLPACPMLNHHTCQYPSPLSAGGIMFKLCQALRQKGWKRIDIYEAIIIAGISTVTDMVPTTSSEIRFIIHRCIKLIQHSNNAGIQALLADSGLTLKKTKRKIMNQAALLAQGMEVEGITESDIGFYIGPRINATGRLYSIQTGVSALTGAPRDAHQASKNNDERKLIQKAVFRYHLKTIDDTKLFHIKYANNQQFDLEKPQQEKVGGVNGIAAQNIVQLTGKPTAVGSRLGEEFTFSLRSIPGLNILDLLEKHSDLIMRFGGHAAAAGMTVHSSQLKKLEDAFNESCKEYRQQGVIFRRHFYIDCVLNKITAATYQAIYKKMGPFGQGNPSPVFLATNRRIYHKPRLHNGNAFKESGFCSLSFQIQDVPFSVRYYGDDLFTWIKADSSQALDIAFQLDCDKGGEIYMRVLDIRPHQ